MGCISGKHGMTHPPRLKVVKIVYKGSAHSFLQNLSFVSHYGEQQAFCCVVNICRGRSKCMSAVDAPCASCMHWTTEALCLPIANGLA